MALKGFLDLATGSQKVLIGPFVDSANAKDLESALTILNTDIKLSKNGKAQVNKNSGGGTYDATGMYQITLDEVDTNEAGLLEIICNMAGALIVTHSFWIGPLPANIEQLGDSAQSLTDLKDFADAGYDPATHKVQGVVLNDTTTTNTDMRGTDSAATASALSAVNSLVTAIKVVTDKIGNASVIISGTVDYTGEAASTTEFEADDITEATDDHYNGRIIVFTSGAVAGQVTDITDYTLNAGRGHFTVTALTEAPADDVTFFIL